MQLFSLFSFQVQVIHLSSFMQQLPMRLLVTLPLFSLKGLLGRAPAFGSTYWTLSCLHQFWASDISMRPWLRVSEVQVWKFIMFRFGSWKPCVEAHLHLILEDGACLAQDSCTNRQLSWYHEFPYQCWCSGQRWKSGRIPLVQAKLGCTPCPVSWDSRIASHQLDYSKFTSFAHSESACACI